MAPKKGQVPERYSNELWATIKALYESGNYSIRAIRDDFGKLYPKFPTEVSIENRKKKEGWVKGKQRPAIDARVERSIQEHFVELGLPEEKVYEQVVSGVLLGDRAVEAIARYVQQNGSEFASKEFQELLKGFLSDKNTILKYIQEYFKLTGKYAAEKRQVTGANGGPVQMELSEEDAKDKLKKMLENDDGSLKEKMLNLINGD